MTPSSQEMESPEKPGRFSILRGTHVEVDPKALGIGLEALLMIELSKHNRGIVDQFLNNIVRVPEVRSSARVGDLDD